MLRNSGTRTDGNEGVRHIPQSSSIRLFSVLSRTLVGGGLMILKKNNQCILQPKPTAQDYNRGFVNCLILTDRLLTMKLMLHRTC